MSTVRDIVNRLYRTYLTPPDAQPAQVSLAAPLTDGAAALVTLGQFTIVEDENLLRQGSVLECEEELWTVVSWDVVTRIATVLRGQFGTEAVPHTVPNMVTLSPTYPRQSVFEAVRDNIVGLYPSLYTVKHTALASVSGEVFPISDPNIVEILQVWPDQGSREVEIAAQVVDFHPQAAGRAIVTKVPLGSIWVRYRSRMGVAESMDDTLEDLGVEDVWAVIVMVGVAADLFAGRDLPASHVEWVGQVLQAENIQVGTRTSLSVGLARYRDLLIKRFQKEMAAEDANKVEVYVNDPFRQVG
jgi:hypothetical protein